MTARLLNPDEWQRVAGEGIAALLPYTEPQNIAIVAVEEDGEIVASVAVLRVSHFEGLWIKPEYRGNAGVFRALIRKAYEVPRSRGEQWVVGAAEHGDARMHKLCGRLGGRQLPVEMFAMPVGE